MIPVNSMPLPIYLLVSWGSAIGIVIFCLKNTHKYNKTMLLSLFLISSSAFFSGVFRFTSELELFSIYIDIIEILALPGILGVPLFMIGGYIHVKDDPYKRKLMLYLSIGVALCLTAIPIIIVLALLGR
ncbi:hypothetical protein [Chengkuizengella sediminis]|uniref:hypothetical protein n=1 Tax=Chengkuizengella sediminis TaxID=1885917 RepID=UPI001389E7C0|nr:hypothetical protein [Chengkuizengella sediminis]NDI35365.1 hypothetical protein [Chengkuizengella sediminis]